MCYFFQRCILFFYFSDGAVSERRGGRNRIYLRRLSGSEVSSTSAAIASLSSARDAATGGRESASANDADGSGGLFFRPFSVQERIRELNVRARSGH